MSAERLRLAVKAMLDGMAPGRPIPVEGPVVDELRAAYQEATASSEPQFDINEFRKASVTSETPETDTPETFQAGDPVIYSFNGDSYTTIVVRASATRLLVGDGTVFTRRRDGKWRSKGHGTWTLHPNRNGATTRLSPDF